MSQNFNLRLATESITDDAQQLSVTIEQLLSIRVDVVATIILEPKSYLWLTYQITLPHSALAAQLNWPIWQPAQVGFSDYLWEQTCLECFIQTKVMDARNTDTGYIEINTSPSGRYALYQFDSYRNPSTLPPTPLLKTDSKSRAHIKWADSLLQLQKLSTLKLRPTLSPFLATPSTAVPISIFTPLRYHDYGQVFYERSFGVPLAQLSNQTANTETIPIERLHPCVILWFGEIALYFAPNHASPPDFHQCLYWSLFDHTAALSK